MNHKAGFVNIIGMPNAGKSTLMNALVGENLSIITPKIQTTRHKIMGIVTGNDFQIVYSDTPGILKPHHLLHESMMGSVETALQDADILLLLTEIHEDFKHDEILKKIQQADIPVLLLLNKIDLADQQTVNAKIEYWKTKLKNAEVIPISALLKFNMEGVLNRILEKLPESPPYFSKDQLTDKTERFFASEIIREKILLCYQKEIPYSVEVEIESYKEEKTIVKISAVIYVERDSQKPILIGHKGKALKKVGIEARKDLEHSLQKQVYLELFVKVSKDWRNNKMQLKRFGY